MTPYEVDQRIAAALERLADSYQNSKNHLVDDMREVAQELRGESEPPTPEPKPEPEPCVTPVVGRWCRLRNGTYEWCRRGQPAKYNLDNCDAAANGKNWHDFDDFDVVEVMPEGWEPKQ